MKTFAQKVLFVITIADILSIVAVHAQIIYTDVNPDTTYTSSSYYLNLNNDNVNEFVIRNYNHRRYFTVHLQTIRFENQ